MQQINHKYALYFNKKYQRIGHLWQGRFKSWYVTDDRYLTVLIRYIEQNPIRAGITNYVGEFAWSSSITNELEISITKLQQLKLIQRSTTAKDIKDLVVS